MSRLSRNIVYNLCGQLTLLVLSFVSAKHVFGHLGGDALGLIYFALMLNTIVVAILELGITATTVKEISANEHRDPVYVVRVVRSGAFFYWIGYALVALGVLVFVPLVVRHWIKLETLSPDVATYVLRILGVSTLLSLPKSFYVAVFRGMQRMGTPNVIDVVTTAAQHGGTIVIALVLGSVEMVAWWIASVYLARLLLYGLLTARMLGWLSIVPTLDWDIVRRNRRFAANMMAVSLLAMVHTQADKILISNLLPVASVGIYGLLYGAVARGGVLTSAVAQGAFPALSELVAGDSHSSVVRQYHRLQDLLCYGLVPVFAFVAFAARPLFAPIFGPGTAASLVAPASLLALGFYLNGTLHIPYFLSLATDKPEIGVRLNFYALFMTMPVTVGLTWQWGFTGAAASWVWYQVFAYTYAVPRICRECIGIAPIAWYRHMARVLALLAGSYGLAGLFVALTLVPNVLNLLVAYLCATALFFAGSWFTVREDSRTSMRNLLRSALRTFRGLSRKDTP